MLALRCSPISVRFFQPFFVLLLLCSVVGHGFSEKVRASVSVNYLLKNPPRQTAVLSASLPPDRRH